MPLQDSQFRTGLNGGGSERALNDISLTIGFCMLVLVFVLVPYLTLLQQIAVQLPSVAESSGNGAGPAPEVLEIDVVVGSRDDGSRIVFVEGNEVVLRDLLSTLVALHQEELSTADQVGVAVRGDRRLSYQEMVEVLDALKSLNGYTKAVPQYRLLYKEGKGGS